MKFIILIITSKESEKRLDSQSPIATNMVVITKDTIIINVIASSNPKENKRTLIKFQIPDLDSSAFTSQIMFSDF